MPSSSTSPMYCGTKGCRMSVINFLRHLCSRGESFLRMLPDCPARKFPAGNSTAYILRQNLGLGASTVAHHAWGDCTLSAEFSYTKKLHCRFQRKKKHRFCLIQFENNFSNIVLNRGQLCFCLSSLSGINGYMARDR